MGHSGYRKLMVFVGLVCLLYGAESTSQTRSLESDVPGAARDGANTKQTYPAIVATVNGAPISGNELERLLMAPSMRTQLSDELGGTDPDETALEQLALSKLVQRSLILQEAARREISVTDTELDQAVVGLRRQFSDLEAFGLWMKDNGLDDQSMFRTIHENMLVARTTAALIEDVEVTAGAVREHYEAHAENLRFEDVWIQIIVVDDLDEASEIRRAIADGEDFGELARRRSLGRHAPDGGDMGWITTEELGPPLRGAVAELAPGEAIGPLARGETEFLIVRLQERRPGLLKTLAEATPQIEALLAVTQQQEALREWIAAQEAAAEVEVLLTDGPRAPIQEN